MKKKETLEEKVELLLGYMSELSNSEEIEKIKDMLDEIKGMSKNVDNDDVYKFIEKTLGSIEEVLNTFEDIQNDITDNLYNLILENTEIDDS